MPGLRCRRVDTPVGVLVVAASDRGLARIVLPGPVIDPDHPLGRVTSLDGGAVTWVDDDPVLEAAAVQLTEYFAGTRRTFDLPLDPVGTDFERDVWSALADVPYGETISYGRQAEAVGRPAAFRAVGAANGRNPLPIVLPCHRVIGADGSLVGFGGGLALKRRLLELEAAQQPLPGLST